MATLNERRDRSNLKGLIDDHIRLEQRFRKTERIVSMTPGNILANSAVEVDITVPGTTAQSAKVSGQVQDAGLSIISSDFIANNTLRVRFFNSTGGTLTAVSGDYRIKVFE